MLLVKVDDFSNKICQTRRSRRNIIVHKTTAEQKTLKLLWNVMINWIKFKTSVLLHWIHRNTHLNLKLWPVHYGADAADVGGMLQALTQQTCLCVCIVGAFTSSGWGMINMGPCYCDNFWHPPATAARTVTILTVVPFSNVGDLLSMTTALFLTTDGPVSVPLKLIIRRLSDALWNSCFLQGKLFDNLYFS